MPTNKLTGKVEYASGAQRRFMHAKHPKIAARWDREIRAQRVRKGLKRDVALGLATGTIGGIAANQLPQNQTPTKAALKPTGKRKRFTNAQITEYESRMTHDHKGRRLYKAQSAPEIGVSGLGAAQRERRKATAQSLGYGAAAAGTGVAGSTLTAARWAPKALQKPLERGTPKITQQARRLAGKTPTPAGERALTAFHSSQPGKRFTQLSRWAKKNPKTAVAGAAALKGTALAAGLASRYRREEASGLSHEIGTTRGVRRHQREVSKRASGDLVKRGEAVSYSYLDPKPTRIAGDGGVPIRNPIKPLDALAAAELSNIPYGSGRRLGLRRSKQQDNLRRSYGQQMQTALGVGRAMR